MDKRRLRALALTGAFGGLLLGCYGDGGIEVSGILTDVSGKPVPDAKIELAIDADAQAAPEPSELYTPVISVSDEFGRYCCIMTFPPNSTASFRLSVKKPRFADYDEKMRDSRLKHVIVLKIKEEVGIER